MNNTYKLIVNGKVQNVGYRYFVYRNAIDFGIKGYAKNLIDGNVEVVITANDDIINSFIDILKIGPPKSLVKRILIEQLSEVKNFEEFNIY